MKIRFKYEFYKRDFYFPLCVAYRECPEYLQPTKMLSLHFLWWHCAWFFESKTREEAEAKLKEGKG